MLRIPDPKEAEAFFRARLTFTAGPYDVNRMLDKGEEVVIVDVRAPEDYAQGHIPGAVNFPVEDWNDPSYLSKDSINLFYCYNPQCHLAARAAYKFAALGYPVMEMEGGFSSWRKHSYQEERAGRGPALDRNHLSARH